MTTLPEALPLPIQNLLDAVRRARLDWKTNVTTEIWGTPAAQTWTDAYNAAGREAEAALEAIGRRAEWELETAVWVGTEGGLSFDENQRVRAEAEVLDALIVEAGEDRALEVAAAYRAATVARADRAGAVLASDDRARDREALDILAEPLPQTLDALAAWMASSDDDGDEAVQEPESLQVGRPGRALLIDALRLAWDVRFPVMVEESIVDDYIAAAKRLAAALHFSDEVVEDVVYHRAERRDDIEEALDAALADIAERDRLETETQVTLPIEEVPEEHRAAALDADEHFVDSGDPPPPVFQVLADLLKARDIAVDELTWVEVYNDETAVVVHYIPAA